MTPNISVGDKVRFTKGNQPHDDPTREYTVGCVHEDEFFLANGEAGVFGISCGEHDTSWKQLFSLMELNGVVVTKNYKQTSSNSMSLKEKFILTFISEPKKSFRKAGITDGDNMPTDEGMRIYVAWKMHGEDADAFKAEIVDGLLKEDKKE